MQETDITKSVTRRAVQRFERQIQRTVKEHPKDDIVFEAPDSAAPLIKDAIRAGKLLLNLLLKKAWCVLAEAKLEELDKFLTENGPRLSEEQKKTLNDKGEELHSLIVREGC